MKLLSALTLAALAAQAHAKAVFAHFMIGNTGSYGDSDWIDDIQKAKDAHIDAFALNIAHGDSVNSKSLEAIFGHAAGTGVGLFFSFDYAGNGAWPKDEVTTLINTYKAKPAYYYYNGKPFVSTFEGPGNADDWNGIKTDTGCFFMPDWSSLGAKEAVQAGNKVADGLFSWAAWPWGFWDMFTYSDASYKQYMGGKPYMMPISPWFYTNMPGYNKNWLWRGDHIWTDRWFQAAWWQPEFVEIISWNDYGESHYIGPVRDNAMVAFDTGKAPYNYGKLDHKGWRDLLPFMIDLYKNNVSTVDYEGGTAWYRLAPASACNTGGTTGNTASQVQIEFTPGQLLQDTIYFAGVLASAPSKVECVVGGTTSTGRILQQPENGVAGMYTGECPIAGRSGSVAVNFYRGGSLIFPSVTGDAISSDCSKFGGYNNYNAFVASSFSTTKVSAKSPDISHLECVNGTGMPTAAKLCEISCGLGYCPPTACTCTRFGKMPTRPKSSGIKGYPVATLDESFSGLCSFDCDMGNCPSAYCSTNQVALQIWPESLFDPPACTGGIAAGNSDYDELCGFTCQHGFCPSAVCQCSTQGFLNWMDPNTTSNATSWDGNDHGLCAFACARGVCPSDMCYDAADPDAYNTPYDAWGHNYDPVLDDYVNLTDAASIACDPATKPSTLDDVLSAVNSQSIPPLCWNQWALSILFRTLLDSQEEYASASGGGYDKFYNAYKDGIKSSVDPKLLDYMGVDTGDGNKFFDCVLTYGGHTYDKMGCQYLDLNSLLGDASWNIVYTLRDETGFYNDVFDKLGIEKAWIKFADWDGGYTCAADNADSPRPGTGTRPCRKLTHTKKNVPRAVDQSQIDVANPKDVVEAAMPNITALGDVLLGTYLDVALHMNEADSNDIIQATAMPVFMLQQAINSMKEIAKIGSQIIDENRKQLILEIISIVIMIIPFAGEAIGAVFGGAAMVARVVSLVDLAANGAVTVAQIVDDPASAPYAILGLLIGGLGGGLKTQKEAFGEAAAARRGLAASDIAKFGDDFAKSDDLIQKLVSACQKA